MCAYAFIFYLCFLSQLATLAFGFRLSYVVTHLTPSHSRPIFPRIPSSMIPSPLVPPSIPPSVLLAPSPS